MKSHLFAVAARDEIWVRGALVQRRIEHGQSRCDGRQIVATDRLDPDARQRCDAIFERHLHVPRELDDCRVRLIASARRVEADDQQAKVEDISISVTLGRVSVVTTPDQLQQAIALLREASRGQAAPPVQGWPTDRTGEDACPPLPLLWLNGSVAVLLHEAAGHAAEHGAASLDWPEWLTIRDVPRRRMDDAGERPVAANLGRGEAPASFRRASFRDVPLRRMTDVVVEHRQAPFEMPAERIEIHLVEGGSYDPLADVVSLRIACATLVRKGEREALEPFDIFRPRTEIAASLIGASGDPIPYPGVVCSREGQELLVGSMAPVMLTNFDA